MSKPGLSFGLNLAKKPASSKPAPPKRKPLFGADDSDDEGSKDKAGVQEIGGGDFDDVTSARPATDTQKRPTKSSNGAQPPRLKVKAAPNTMFGDLSSTLASRKNAEAATDLDASVYEYDTVYDSIKPKKQATKEDQDKRPKYMRSLMEAADTRKRDALIAEEKKIAREREAEGEEFAGKDKFVTEAYKRQQEENRRIEEEEKRREEAEAKKNKGGGMSAFYRKLLDKDEERHAEVVKAAEDAIKDGPTTTEIKGDVAEEEDESDVKKAKDLAEKQGIAVAVNEDGQVVDKRQLLRGGLNVAPKKKEAMRKEAEQQSHDRDGDSRPSQYQGQQRGGMNGMQGGRKQAMRERQSRMMVEQLEQSMKRSREEEAAQKEEIERVAKTRKTEGEISSAKERYLARKRAAEEEKKKSKEGAAA